MCIGAQMLSTGFEWRGSLVLAKLHFMFIEPSIEQVNHRFTEEILSWLASSPNSMAPLKCKPLSLPFHSPDRITNQITLDLNPRFCFPHLPKQMNINLHTRVHPISLTRYSFTLPYHQTFTCPYAHNTLMPKSRSRPS